MKTTVSIPVCRFGIFAGFARFFDIVNGFFNRCRGASYPTDVGGYYDAALTDVIWLRLSSAPVTTRAFMQACR